MLNIELDLLMDLDPDLDPDQDLDLDPGADLELDNFTCFYMLHGFVQQATLIIYHL